MKSFFVYALENYDFEWLFKFDDDTYVDLGRLESLVDDEYDLIGDALVSMRNSPSGDVYKRQVLRRCRNP